MIPIYIDTSSILEEVSLTQQEINGLMDFVVKEITVRFAQEWQNEANNTLKTSRTEYITNINVVDEGFARGAVVLTGWLPNAVEQGLSSFDMKEGLINGPNSRPTKSGGRMNIVPFKLGAPGSLPENFSAILPTEVHSVLKSKPLVQTIKGGGVSTRPLKAEEIPEQFREPQKKQVTLPQSKSIKEYQHKSSIYQGVRRVRDAVTNQTSYQSFRAVSSNSDPAAWIHPGIEASNLAEATLNRFDIPSEVVVALDKWFEQRG